MVRLERIAQLRLLLSDQFANIYKVKEPYNYDRIKNFKCHDKIAFTKCMHRNNFSIYNLSEDAFLMKNWKYMHVTIK